MLIKVILEHKAHKILFQIHLNIKAKRNLLSHLTILQVYLIPVQIPETYISYLIQEAQHLHFQCLKDQEVEDH